LAITKAAHLLIWTTPQNSTKASQQNFQTGKYNSGFRKIMLEWMEEVKKAPK